MATLLRRALGSSKGLESPSPQSDYYANAAIYLGFLARSNYGFTMTNMGLHFIGMRSLSTRTELMVEQIRRRPVFRAVFDRWKWHNLNLDALSQEKVAALIAAYTPLSGSTPRRRASTVMQWLRWVQHNTTIYA